MTILIVNIILISNTISSLSLIKLPWRRIQLVLVPLGSAALGFRFVPRGSSAFRVYLLF